MQRKTLISLLDVSAQQFPKKTAAVFNSSRLTYAELQAQAERLAAGLKDRFGIGRGDFVCILMTNALEYLPCFFGILKSGAAVIPVNTFLSPSEIAFIIDDARPRAVIAGGDLMPHLTEALKKTSVKPDVIAVDGEAGGAVPLPSLVGNSRFCAQDVDAGDTAVLGYTSGTTGIPKGAMLSHRNLVANVTDCVWTLRVTSRDRFIVFLPLFHSFTMTVCMLTPLAGGGSLYILKSVKPFASVMKTLVFKRITAFVAIPQIFHLLSEKKFPLWLRLLLRVRFCISGSAPLSEEVLRSFQKNTGLVLMEGYGLTEASPVVSVNPLYGKRKVGTVGPPLPRVKVRIVDASGGDVPCGEPGEVCIGGPSVMKGYFEKPEETANVLRDGWLLTGDIGRVDEDGYLSILDRKKEMLKCHGMNVYPREIEQVLYAHPAVKDAAVIGVADQHRGEAPVACVSLKEGSAAASAELVRFCKDKLAPYKIPHKVKVVTDFPRNSTGKILKRELKERFLAGAL